MTMERASEIVMSLSDDAKRDTFAHFVHYFKLEGIVQIGQFAGMCGIVMVNPAEVWEE